MTKGLLDPKMDFVFKSIFGSEKNPEILISFLNATLKPEKLITSVEIKNTDIEKTYIEDKFSRLDVKATTSNDEIINIEIPKLDDNSNEKDMLVAWTEFLKNPESEKVRNLEMTVEEIRQAKDQLVKMSQDEKQRQLYEMREKSLRDEISALNNAEKEGIEKGIEKIALNMIKKGKSIEDVVDVTELSYEKVIELKEILKN